jgi:hypothetical protein
MRIAQIVVAAIVVALIVTYGFGSVFLMLALIAAFYVLIVIILPIVIRSKLRMMERPAVHPVEYDDPALPETVRAQLHAQRDALMALGFEPRGVIHQPPGIVQPAYLALFRHPERRARALARLLMTPGKRQTTVQAADVEMVMWYDDGTIVELSNVSGAAHGLENVPGIARQMPQLRDTARLFHYFEKLAAKYERENDMSTQARVPLSDDATATSVYHEQLEKSYAIQRRAGLVAPANVPGLWRPTWRYALMIAGGLISPGPDFVRRRLDSRGERLRRDLDGDSRRSTAERIGARNGWILLGLGLVLIAFTVLASLTASSMAFLGMVASWWLVKRRGQEPDWRTILLGGAAATVLLATPMAMLEYALPFGPGAFPVSVLLMAIQMYAVPIAVLTLAAAFLVEGFRAAAT